MRARQARLTLFVGFSAGFVALGAGPVAEAVIGQHHRASAAIDSRAVSHVTPTTPPTSPPSTLPPLRTPTATSPLRVLVLGDSLGVTLGRSLAAKLDRGGLATTTVDARESTGLARPDVFNWQAQLRADIVEFHPEVIVASFGANDDQDLQVNGRSVVFPSTSWQTAYADRVRRFADEARVANARFLWSGLPVVQSVAKTDRFATVMIVTAAALRGQDDVVFVDNFPTLADPSGNYQASLVDASGVPVLVRQPDGIHETVAGGDRLADAVIASMRSAWQLAL